MAKLYRMTEIMTSVVL